MEALGSLSEIEPIETLRVALDQMAHFLWFYSQVISNEPEFGDRMPPTGITTANDQRRQRESSSLDQFPRVDELMLLRHQVDAKRQQPN
jgi:hypothetical protein